MERLNTFTEDEIQYKLKNYFKFVVVRYRFFFSNIYVNCYLCEPGLEEFIVSLNSHDTPNSKIPPPIYKL